jgi:hypothetical protein
MAMTEVRTDRDLLDEFLCARNEDAFAEIVITPQWKCLYQLTPAY